MTTTAATTRLANLRAIAAGKQAEWDRLEADIARLNELADIAAHASLEAEREAAWLEAGENAAGGG